MAYQPHAGDGGRVGRWLSRASGARPLRLSGSVRRHDSSHRLFVAWVRTMSVQLDHIMVPSRDRRAAAELLATLLGVPWADSGAGPFCAVYVNEGLTLDIDQVDGPFPIQHYCFRVSETEFEGIVARIRARGIRSSRQGGQHAARRPHRVLERA